MQVLFDIPNFFCIMQLRAENQNLVSALSNYQQILYQFFDFTQNLKQSRFSLLKGNYSSVHGKVFETTNDRKGYAKALGKPVLLIGICLLFSGVIAVILPKDYAISIAVIFILFIAVICSIWLYKIQKRFS